MKHLLQKLRVKKFYIEDLPAYSPVDIRPLREKFKILIIDDEKDVRDNDQPHLVIPRYKLVAEIESFVHTGGC